MRSLEGGSLSCIMTRPLLASKCDTTLKREFAEIRIAALLRVALGQRVHGVPYEVHEGYAIGPHGSSQRAVAHAVGRIACLKFCIVQGENGDKRRAKPAEHGSRLRLIAPVFLARIVHGDELAGVDAVNSGSGICNQLGANFQHALVAAPEKSEEAGEGRLQRLNGFNC
jgi:hypothetical protein